MGIAHSIDHTLLRRDAHADDIKKLCDEALQFHFRGICVRPHWVEYVVDYVLPQDQTIHIAAAIGFPLVPVGGYHEIGNLPLAEKIREAEEALTDGATELDIVLNNSHLRENLALAEREMRAFSTLGVPVKVILETPMLTDQQITDACYVALETGVDAVKTSTGFVEPALMGKNGALVPVVSLMKSIVEERLLVKASGGIRDYAAAKQLIDAGADIIGTSSGVDIYRQSL